MCGIFAVFGFQDDPEKFRQRCAALSKKVRHRGPDWSGIKVSGQNILCHERLSIVGVSSGAQPLTNADGSVILAVNGEIYNYEKLKASLNGKYKFKTASDCEVILYLWEEFGVDLVKKLDGMYSFVLYDSKKDVFLACRDHVGITTLYQGFRSSDNSVWFASEMKSLNEDCDKIIAFPPGHYYTSATKSTVQYYNPFWYGDIEYNLPNDEGELSKMSVQEEQLMYKRLRESLEMAVQKRLMSEVPYGVLLSGGLDSSLTASIAVRMRQNASVPDMVKDGVTSWPTLHSFCIGLEGSPDLAAAQKVADFLGTKHHGFTFTLEEGIDAVADVIYHLETYDVTTVRASTPMYLLSRKIKALGVKMVLSGEGSDEIFGGYLYFHNAPSAKALHHECIKRIQNLHYADNLRANKSTMAWGLEARVPFLDREFLDVAMSVNPNQKLTGRQPYNYKMEKYILRKAFDTPEQPYLPDEVLWRQKEQFSDGVGYSWIDGLKDFAEKSVSDLEMKNANERFPFDTPTTKEAYLFRHFFENHFPQKACLESVVRWIPRKDWGCSEDPSGRAQKGHIAAYK